VRAEHARAACATPVELYYYAWVVHSWLLRLDCFDMEESVGLDDMLARAPYMYWEEE
jgi:hypothetical protein